MTIIETVAVLIAIAFYPFMERQIWNVMQYSVDKCDVTSRAYDAIEFVQMSVSLKIANFRIHFQTQFLTTNFITQKFKCCGLNHPDSMSNDTRIQTSCYTQDKFTIYNSYCKPESYYKINCFDRVYNDCMEKLFNILVYSVITIAMQVRSSTFSFRFFFFVKLILLIQGLTIYFAVLHGLRIQRDRNNAIELATIDDDVVISRYKRKNGF